VKKRIFEFLSNSQDEQIKKVTWYNNWAYSLIPPPFKTVLLDLRLGVKVPLWGNWHGYEPKKRSPFD
jgi:hypothetical protein